MIMKNNPKRHKAQNTFRFQTFSERISNIDIDVFHKVKHPYEEDDDVQSTYFCQCLTKWNNENFTPDFIDLKKKLPFDVSLPQILARKEEIVGLLVAHLKNCEIDSLQPALELIVALTKDLRKEFYPYFCPSILRECVHLLDTREPEQIEWVFTCLAHTFKYLWAPIIRNINDVLVELLPLLSSSKPRYINNFAAESFAFVARKVRDKKQFLLSCLKNIKDTQEELAGISKLFFEVIKSVGNQFHSAAEEFILILLRELSNQKWSALVYTLCDNFVTNMVSFVSAKTDVSCVWKSFMIVTKEFYSAWVEQNDELSARNLRNLLELTKRLLGNADMISRYPAALVEFVLELTTDPNIKKFFDLHFVVIDIISKLLIRGIANSEDVIVKVFGNIENEELVVRFAENIIVVSEYESVTFQELLKLISNHPLSDVFNRFLAKVVWMKTGFQFKKNVKLEFYSSAFRFIPNALIEAIVNRISTPLTHETSERIVEAIVVACNIESASTRVTREIDKVLKNLCEQISRTESVEHVAKLLYILLVSFQSRICYNTNKPSNFKQLAELAAKYVDSSNYLCSLRILDSLSLQDEEQDCLNSLDRSKLINNLCSPFHKVRLFTLHVMTKLDMHPIFEHLYLIESIVPSVQSYRDKLHKLQQLEFNEKFVGQVPTRIIRTAVLKFLFGNLYLNFQYMWEPVQKLISTHLDGDEEAWAVFEYQLRSAVTNDIESVKLMKNFVVDFQCDFLRKHFYEQNGVDDRPDFYNFRCLLLGVLTNCKSFGLKNQNFLPELFLQFYKSEYAVNAYDFKSCYNIKKLEDGHGVPLDEADEDKGEPKNNKNLNKLFVILLKLINNTSHQLPQKQRDEFYNIHLEILCNGNSEVQQAAINYICKKKNLSHYKDRLLSLTKENSFKDELLNIRIDFQSHVIHERDRDDLLKIILRILYEKVRKKSCTHLRESIFEFLTICNDAYMTMFFDMFFKYFISYVRNSTDPMQYLKDEIDLENTLPPSCFLIYVNTALDMLKRCGSLLSHTCISYLLRVVLKSAASMVVLSNAKTDIHPGYYGILSKLRVVSFEAIIFLFENFEYRWSEEEMNAVMQYFVEPWIDKVQNECLQSANPVMKLFIVFTKNTRYFPLLAHRCGDLTAMDALMSLLNSDKVCFNVKNSILEVVERLLTLEEENEEDVASDLMYMNNSLENQWKEKRQYGTQLVLPYVSTILTYLEKSLAKRYVKLNGIYMLILKRISEFGLNEDASVMLLTLLMPVLKSRVTADEDVVMPLLDTIFNLFRTLEKDDLFEAYLLQMAYLFNVATASTVRCGLRDIVKYIGEKTGTKFINADFVYGLNVYDARFVEQADYAGRLETYKRVNEASEKGELNLYSGVFVIYNAFYMLKNERDIALRDHSGLCLKRICPVLASQYPKSSREYEVLLNETLLPLIKDGIQHKNENCQAECVALLGHMARECPTLHPVFKNLHVLTDSNDLDNDFFESIQHLQLRRRTKALKRFSEIMCEQIKPPQAYSLLFLLPLVSRHLLCDKVAHEPGIVNASIEALKVICRLSTWNHYERILKHYVMEMRKNVALRKQAIRIISAVLDSFHFDISLAGDKDDQKEVMEVDEPIKKSNAEPAVKRATQLCRSDAQRVYKSIKSFLVPSLDRIFMTYEDSDRYHKLSKKTPHDDKEEMAVLSIPIAYAAVKLLKRLPRTLLDQYISNIFLKLSTYLKSRLLSIRLVARETMQNILMEIGPSYFPKLLSEMMSILTKGFQIHVLVFTCHAILEKIQSLFTSGQIDGCIDSVLEICIVDLFGKLAEEKEVVQISSKTPEAKGNKSYNMLSILAEYISENRILDLILPLKEMLTNNMSSKIVGKVSRCLKYIALGLTRNRFLNEESLLVFAYGVSNDCIPTLVMERENSKVRIGDGPIEKQDSFIIPQEPKFLTAEKRKICGRTNAHVMIEFGLELLESMLKREKIRSGNYRPHLDPFIPVITDSIQSQYNKLVIISLKCLYYLRRRDLPSLNEKASTICESVFTILGKYSSAAVSGENGELLMSAAKVGLILVRDLKYTINDDQLRILLYVVEDLQKNISHYATGFSLLRAILARKYCINEVHELMRKTGELSILAYSRSVRAKAREAYYQYLVNYPHRKKKLHDMVEFVAAQLKYEEVFGRESALELLQVIVASFPKEELRSLSTLLFLKLACRLIEDDNAECKKMAAKCIALIIERVQDTKEERDLFDATIKWLNENKVHCRTLAIQLLGIFVDVKKDKIEQTLYEMLPLIENQLYTGRANGVGRFVKAPALNQVDDNAKGETDALVFQVLHLYKKVMENCPNLLTDEKYVCHVQRISDNCQSLLKHSHEWVRLGATQVLGIVLQSLDIAQVTDVLTKKKKANEFGFLIDQQSKEQIKRLCQDLCDQLIPGHEVLEQLLQQTMKNLLFLVEVLQNLPCSDRKKLSLPWLVDRLVNKVRKEVAHAPQQYTMRTLVFDWLMELAKLDQEKLISVLRIVLLPILRELSTSELQGKTIRDTAKKVLKCYRKKVEADIYDKTVIEVQRKLDKKRADRKVKVTEMAVVDPERAARRKVKLQQKKKEQRKRRLEKLRKRKFKNKRRVEIPE